MALAPEWLRGYQRAWLRQDVLAGLTLSAIAIPEVMGYTSIAGTPIVTGIYTILAPTVVFAFLGSSWLLVVGADSATAAVLASGLAGLGIAGLTPGSPSWLAWSGLVALLCAALLVVARLLHLGFIGDFLSAPVLTGFLTGVGVQVLTGQLPELLGLPKPSGNWFQQLWATVTALPQAHAATVAFGVGAIVAILGMRRFAPAVPGAIVVVIGTILASAWWGAAGHGVAVVGAVAGGLPSVGVPTGMSWSSLGQASTTVLGCLVIIIAQSAATSRSFAAKHGQRVDVNRDLVGLAGANLAAGLTGTFVVNGSPTKTEVLEDQKGRTQVANIVMSLVGLGVVTVGVAALAPMPKAVLAAIVVVIGAGLIDVRGLLRIRRERTSEFVVALVTAAVVCVVGVEQGLAVAVTLSLLDVVRRAYRPRDFVIGQASGGQRVYAPAQPGAQSLPGLVVFRFDAQLFYANAGRFVDDVMGIVHGAPEAVRWLVLDCSSIDDVDFSAGIALQQLVQTVHTAGIHFGLVRADPDLLATLGRYGVLDSISSERVFPDLGAVFDAFQGTPGSTR